MTKATLEATEKCTPGIPPNLLPEYHLFYVSLQWAK